MRASLIGSIMLLYMPIKFLFSLLICYTKKNKNKNKNNNNNKINCRDGSIIESFWFQLNTYHNYHGFRKPLGLERWQSCLLQHYTQQHWCCKGIKRTCIHGFKTNLLGCHEPHSVNALQPNL